MGGRRSAGPRRPFVSRSRGCVQPPCTTAPVPLTSDDPGIVPEPTFAINVRGTHHLIEGLRDAGDQRARADPEFGDGVRRQRRSRFAKIIRCCPRESVRAEQAGAGNGRRRQILAGPMPSSRGRSIISARGRTRGSSRQASHAGSPTSRLVARNPKSLWGISMRAAISPTSATRSARTVCWRSAESRACVQRVLRSRHFDSGTARHAARTRACRHHH